MGNQIIKIENLSKEYRLGQIGGGTLTGDLQSWWAKIRGKEDPNAVIGAYQGKKGDRFLALDNISFEVNQGERLGLIGHNGAGKSTLLKILSRVTAPTKGSFSYRGRIASMLEVGTGFHPELTGRENVYLNGAILGMTRAEVSKKFDQIVEFAEMEKFIDTPVKRYSSGMYVKLAFAVAAHLDSEILVMDEVLAVGDMKFQQKCLGKMGDVSQNEGRTVLYVSHNMNTIRQLCNRTVVLDHGKVIYDGGVEEGIGIYSDINEVKPDVINHCADMKRTFYAMDNKHHLDLIELLGKEEAIYQDNEKMKMRILFHSENENQHLCFRLMLYYVDGTVAGMATTKPDIKADKGNNEVILEFSPDVLADGTYKVRIAFYSTNEFGAECIHDVLDCGFSFLKENNINNSNKMTWNHSGWGHTSYPEIKICEE